MTQISEVRFAAEDLVVIAEDELGEQLKVVFESPVGFRVIDESQVCEFWNDYSSPNGWLWVVHSGGYLDLEKKRSGFWRSSDTNLKEYFIVGEYCLSVITAFPPTIAQICV
jgi:hypothetical protein